MNEEIIQPQPPETKLTSEVKGRKSRKFRYLLILAILAGVGFAYWYSNQQKQAENKDLGLSPTEVSKLEQSDQKRVLELQLKQLEEEASKLTPESSRSDRFTTYIQLAEVKTALGDHQGALQALDIIKEERRGNSRLWMTYAQVYKNMGNLVEARKNTFHALDIDAELADNWLFMFTIISDLPKESQEDIYKEALTRSGNLPEITAAYQAWQQQ